MTSTFTQHLCAALIGIAVISSCSRPVAYFQHGPVDPYTASNTQPVTVATPTQAVATPAQPIEQVSTTITQLETYVRNDNKLSTNRALSKRMARVKNLLTSTAQPLESKMTAAPRKMNLVEKLMLRKMNKRFSRQLAPNHPEKAMISTGKLIGGAVLLIAGLIMLFAGTGTVAFIGIILSLIGALRLLVSLLGIDS